MIRESALGPSHPEAAEVLAAIGHANYNDKRFEAAQPFLERVVEIGRTRLNGGESAGLSGDLELLETILNGDLELLGMIYRSQGKLAETEPLVKAVCDARQQVLLNNARMLARLYAGRQQNEEAETMYKIAVAIYGRMMPPRKLSKEELLTAPPPPAYLVETLEEYADVLRKLRRKGEASKMFSRAKQIRSRAALLKMAGGSPR